MHSTPTGGKALEMVVVCGECHGGVVAAVKVVMVIMTFDGFLRGLPIAAVPEIIFLQTGRLSTSRWNCEKGCFHIIFVWKI